MASGRAPGPRHGGRSRIARRKGGKGKNGTCSAKVQEETHRSTPRMRFSVVIPTYNRLPILRKCLDALEKQRFRTHEGGGSEGLAYEVVVVDDGSTDGTVEHLKAHAHAYPHLRLVEASHGGAAAARNRGVSDARGDVIVFIDSDLVVTSDFLQEHALALERAVHVDGDPRAFTYGRVINTDNFAEPTSEPFKATDRSAAFFATGNVAISKRWLLEASVRNRSGRVADPFVSGPFDTDFTEYGWEDLELGERLRQLGVRMVRCPSAVGYHWHPPLKPQDVPFLVEQERQRGRGGARFYRKHPHLRVRLMVQLTPFHWALWFLLTWGGRWNEDVLEPWVHKLCDSGRPRAASFLLSPILNWHCVMAARQELELLDRREARIDA